MPRPVISVVVLVWNRPEYVRACLDSLVATRTDDPPLELVVVDNGSDPPTLAVLLEFQQKGAIDRLVLLRSNLGTAAGYNVGFQAASRDSRYLAKLDSDMVVLTPGWHRELVRVFDDVYDAGIVSMDMNNHAGIEALPVIDAPGGHRLRDWEGWVAGGSGMTFSRENYEKHGGFREDYPDHLKLAPDDYDLYQRFHKAGWRSYFVLAARAHHQTHLDPQYAAYQQFKNRQYDLLATRFFSMVAHEKTYEPFITTVDVEPRRVAPGETFTARIGVHAAEPARGFLGLSVRPAAGGVHDDPEHDVTVDLQPGTHEYERRFRLPPDAPAGPATVAFGLKQGAEGPDRLRSFDHVEREKLLEIAGVADRGADAAP
jgi:GT2 family glycosyltransferase